MSHDALLDFEYDAEERAVLVFRSVEQEIGKIDDDRSRTTVERDGNTVSVRVEAEDLIALRAALNTWQTLVGVAETVAETGDSVRKPSL
ncbi:KEOPS complex Pcc1-like subunit [Haladaptatus sp. W1]|uniref:KEOPS complex subunit Pcc1 n=1 Tax=Haladaptatus sp. W1 TaxID=1897478 RepID=UPI0008497747|nr:KEOPS complex subunit Pcc1 [Haladaptatus sp. W1]ODR82574.1 KEOPS complex Pcc1-like subunit [Haladaptatus sp. W1]